MFNSIKNYAKANVIIAIGLFFVGNAEVAKIPTGFMESLCWGLLFCNTLLSFRIAGIVLKKDQKDNSVSSQEGRND